MHATVTKVTIDPESVEGAEATLREQVVPRVSQAPGFVAGYWTRKDNTGLSMVIFEEEAHAQAASEQIRAAVPAGVSVEDIEVREVVASA